MTPSTGPSMVVTPDLGRLIPGSGAFGMDVAAPDGEREGRSSG